MKTSKILSIIIAAIIGVAIATVLINKKEAVMFLKNNAKQR